MLRKLLFAVALVLSVAVFAPSANAAEKYETPAEMGRAIQKDLDRHRDTITVCAKTETDLFGSGLDPYIFGDRFKDGTRREKAAWCRGDYKPFGEKAHGFNREMKAEF